MTDPDPIPLRSGDVVVPNEPEGAGWIEDRARQLGALLGRQETLRLGELANRYPPELRTHDRFGHR